MRFRFRLESILRLKENEENEAKDHLIKIRLEKQRIESKLSETIQNIEKAKLKVNDLLKVSSVEDAKLWKMYIKSLEKKKREIEEMLGEIERRESEALAFYLEKRKERESLEKLKKRQFEQYRKDLDDIERKLIDEVAQRKFWWKI